MFKIFMTIFLSALVTVIILISMDEADSSTRSVDIVLIVDHKHKEKVNLGEHAHKFGKIISYGYKTITVIGTDESRKTSVPGIIVEERKVFKTSILGCGEKPKPPTEPPPIDDHQVIDWGIKRVDALRAQQINDARSIRVCVLDTGISTLHPDVNFIHAMNFSTSNRSDVEDRQGHGTHTAGLVAAINNEFGVVGASQAQLIIGKVLGDDGFGYNSSIADGIHYCIDQDADIISMSLGGPYSAVVENAVEYAHEKGVEIFAAAGNDSSEDVGYPARFPTVFSISATGPHDELAWFSNHGKIDFACPGIDILSTIPGGYDVMSGTSMATPICAGIAALYKARGIPYKAENLGNREKFGAGILTAKGL